MYATDNIKIMFVHLCSKFYNRLGRPTSGTVKGYFGVQSKVILEPYAMNEIQLFLGLME